MRKSYKVGNMIYTLNGKPYDSTLSYYISNVKDNKSIELNSLNPYQRFLLCMCQDNFNTGSTDLREHGILIIG